MVYKYSVTPCLHVDGCSKDDLCVVLSGMKASALVHCLRGWTRRLLQHLSRKLSAMIPQSPHSRVYHCHGTDRANIYLPVCCVVCSPWDSGTQRVAVTVRKWASGINRHNTDNVIKEYIIYHSFALRYCSKHGTVDRMTSHSLQNFELKRMWLYFMPTPYCV